MGKELSKIQKFVEKNFPHILNDVDYAECNNDSVRSFHISKDRNIKEFIPMVSDRTMKKEDRTVPRICVSYHLWGCMAGYAAMRNDFIELQNSSWYRGGYYIYKIDSGAQVIPNKKLVPDAEWTDERWLVGYDDNHTAIKPEIIGKFFIQSIVVTNNGEDKLNDYTILVELNEPMMANASVNLDVGYWKLTTSGVWESMDPSKVTIAPITKSEFLAAKRISASLLSLDAQSVSSTW